MFMQCFIFKYKSLNALHIQTILGLRSSMRIIQSLTLLLLEPVITRVLFFPFKKKISSKSSKDVPAIEPSRPEYSGLAGNTLFMPAV
jgi:hypothetical protein